MMIYFLTFLLSAGYFLEQQFRILFLHEQQTRQGDEFSQKHHVAFLNGFFVQSPGFHEQKDYSYYYRNGQVGNEAVFAY